MASSVPRLPTAVLWDMDGTLVDTEPYWIESQYELVARHGTTWSDSYAEQLVGRDLTWSARFLREHGGVDLPSLEIVHLMQDGVIARVRQDLAWRPGARELVAALSQAHVPQALVTMSWAGLAWAVVDRLPVSTFATVVSGDRVTRGKPHPDPYLLALDELRLGRHGVVACEDSPTGITAAVAAGVQVIGIPYLLDISSISGVDPASYRIVQTLAELTPELLLAGPS